LREGSGSDFYDQTFFTQTYGKKACFFSRSNIRPAVVSVSKTARVSAISSSTGWFDKFITC
jgi:hypothetical protein